LLSSFVALHSDPACAACPDAQKGDGIMTEKRALTPGGFRPKSQVHKVAPGHILDASGGRLRELDADGNVIADFGPAPHAKPTGPVIPRNSGTAAPKKSR
jgi:hypothetical protein